MCCFSFLPCPAGVEAQRACILNGCKSQGSAALHLEGVCPQPQGRRRFHVRAPKVQGWYLQCVEQARGDRASCCRASLMRYSRTVECMYFIATILSVIIFLGWVNDQRHHTRQVRLEVSRRAACMSPLGVTRSRSRRSFQAELERRPSRNS